MPSATAGNSSIVQHAILPICPENQIGDSTQGYSVSDLEMYSVQVL